MLTNSSRWMHMCAAARPALPRNCSNCSLAPRRFMRYFDKAAGRRLQLEPGAKVRLTGIFDVQSWQPVTRTGTGDFHILLRSPADVEILVTAPWWTSDRALQAIGVVAAAALIAFGWVFVLRRKGHQQTATIRQKLETEVSLRKAAEAASRVQSELTELKRIDRKSTRL